MEEGGGGGGGGGARIEAQTRQRKKRKWDQPAVPGAGVIPFPVGNLGASEVASMRQLKSQEDIVIAREIVINDAEPSLRFRLTKRQTQEEILKCTGAVVITRGRYRPPGSPSDGQKPLYLHISAGAHIKDTAGRIVAVDRAAAVIEEMLKLGPDSQFSGSIFPPDSRMKVNQGMSVCVYLGFDVDPSLDIAARIRGPNDQYISHIMNETGATVLLRGLGSGASESFGEEDVEQPLHLFLASSNSRSLENAKRLAEHLLDTISIECGASRASPSSNVYGAVPPPQQLLPITQSSGPEFISENPTIAVASHIDSAAVLAAASTPANPVANNLFPQVPVQPPRTVLGNGIPGKTMGSYSGSSLSSGTRYKGYEGINPEVTPLQQVALALKHTPLISSPAPSTTSASTAMMSCVSSVSEKTKEKQPLQKRKFQELPVNYGVPMKSNQVLDLVKLSELGEDSDDHERALMPPPKPVTPSLNETSMPAPRSISPLPPVPKFTSSDDVQKKKSVTDTKSESVPETLVKLMEYGDEDEDEDVDETPSESFNNSTFTTQKPFWAV